METRRDSKESAIYAERKATKRQTAGKNPATLINVHQDGRKRRMTVIPMKPVRLELIFVCFVTAVMRVTSFQATAILRLLPSLLLKKMRMN